MVRKLAAVVLVGVGVVAVPASAMLAVVDAAGVVAGVVVLELLDTTGIAVKRVSK